MLDHRLQSFLDHTAERYEKPSFIENDPISVPHRFEDRVDKEIAGFFAAVFSWGLRKTIINKSLELMALMDFAPHDFILHHTDQDLQALEKFKHRTFQPPDTLYFVHFLHEYYHSNETLENAFRDEEGTFSNLESGLNCFRDRFFNSEYALDRCRKHIPSPARKSTTKRINMFLRWMVRSDKRGVDFGLWKQISPAQLYIPLDVHVSRVATGLGLLTRTQSDWEAVRELTENLRKMDPDDPVKYDFALFNMGLELRT